MSHYNVKRRTFCPKLIYIMCKQSLKQLQFVLFPTSSWENPSLQINQTVNIALARKYQKILYHYLELTYRLCIAKTFHRVICHVFL